MFLLLHGKFLEIWPSWSFDFSILLNTCLSVLKKPSQANGALLAGDMDDFICRALQALSPTLSLFYLRYLSFTKHLSAVQQQGSKASSSELKQHSQRAPSASVFCRFKKPYSFYPFLISRFEFTILRKESSSWEKFSILFLSSLVKRFTNFY